MLHNNEGLREDHLAILPIRIIVNLKRRRGKKA
jgi:hypothetical protein